MIEETSQRSGEIFNSGLYCAESVLLSVAENKGIESDLIPKIATGFCAGISRTSGLCGALSGGILSLNLLYGRSRPEESIETCFTAVQKLVDMFEEKFGTTNCMQLIGCDLRTDEGQDTFKAKNLFEDCRNYTEEATRMVMSIIDETPKIKKRIAVEE